MNGELDFEGALRERVGMLNGLPVSALEQTWAETALMDGAAELVQLCRDHQVPMALVTSSTQDAVRRKAAPHRWLELIQVRVYGDDPALAAGKPAPDPFLLAAKRLGRNPGDCWAFEDSAAGIEAAVAAGCQVYALLPSDAEAQATPTGVTRLNSLRDVRW